MSVRTQNKIEIQSFDKDEADTKDKQEIIGVMGILYQGNETQMCNELFLIDQMWAVETVYLLDNVIFTQN